jgi:hypothetical protein
MSNPVTTNPDRPVKYGRSIYRGHRIFEALDAQGKSREWFFREVGIDYSLLYHVKAGQRGVPRWVVKRAVEVLDVPESELFYDRIPLEERSSIRAPKPKRQVVQRLRAKPADARAFWARLTKPDASGCREWTGFLHPVTGYGHASFGGRMMATHRLAFTLAYGAIPKGKHVLHRCGNAACCNPNHLYAGTPLENMRDRDRHGRTTGPKLTEPQAIAILARQGTATAMEVGREFGVTGTTVYMIWSGRSWKHLHAAVESSAA